MRYLYKNLKGHAKGRGIEFTLTFEQWTAFCEETRYHERVGTAAGAATIDRIEDKHGYHHWNIRVLTHEHNSRRDFVPYFRQLRERHETLQRAAEKYGHA